DTVLQEYSLKENSPLPIPEIENKLYTKLYTELFEAIEKTDETEKKELEELFNTIIDYRNFLNIIRLKNFYNTDSKTIEKYILPFGSIKKKIIDKMCEAEDTQSVFDIMSATRFGKTIGKLDYEDIDELELKVKFKKAKHNMYFSDSPATVMMSYIILCEIELHNLICIIEGARYNVDKSVIEPLLIY
ncbi:MAG: V-type ATPase subunit, partial [Ruminococcus sp.]|nr:V-type ATPase subunit [Ruminococcus sp.]